MSRDATTERNRSSEIELPAGGTTNIQLFLETCVLDADHKALKEHLANNQMQQSDLDKCLIRGLQIVQWKERELSHVAQTLAIVLQSSAKWNSDVLLDEQKTPCHVICGSPGDHHELLDLMIKSSQRTILDTRDNRGRTALMYAVQNVNINCVKCLLANGTDVNILNTSYQYDVTGAPPQKSSAIIEAIRMLGSRIIHIKNTSVNEDIFDLLLDKSPFECYMSLIIVAAHFRSVYCIKKLIKKGANPCNIGPYQRYVWPMIARIGNVELLKRLFNHGLDKDSRDKDGVSLLWHVVDSGNVEAVRYLLDLGVVIPTYTLDVRESQCEQCKEHTFIIDENKWLRQESYDPCMNAINWKKFEIVKLLDEHGAQSCKSFNALRWAVINHRVDVVSYLLSRYTYPLNIEYIKDSQTHIDLSGCKQGYTLLTELNSYTCLRLPKNWKFDLQIIKFLLDHGADPTKAMCVPRSPNVIITAIYHGHLKAIAQYIRCGVDINFRSYDDIHGNVLPFESAVLRGYHDVAEMLLISGCSCGVFSLDTNHEFKDNLKPGMEELMKEWKVQENNVTPLKQRCRSVLLNHLSPRADMKIEKLPLPGCLIKFLSIPELDEGMSLFPVE